MDHSTAKMLLKYIQVSDQIPKLINEDLQGDKLIHHTVKLDINKILDRFPDVAEYILEDSDLGEHELRQIIEDELLRIHQKHFQVCVTVEVTSLPPGYNGGTIQRLVDLPPLSKPSMPFLFPAQLVGKSRKFMRTMTSRFRCDNSECAAHRKNHVEDVPFPEKFKGKPMKCLFCQSLLQEIPEERQISHYVIDDLDYLALGEYYRIIGKAIGNGESFYKCIHLSPMEETMPKFLGLNLELHPELLESLANSSEGSWSFVNDLAAKFGSHIAPSGTFHQLKLALLLSLAVSKVDPESPSQLPLLVALLDSSELPIKLLHYGLTLLEDEKRLGPIIHSTESTLASHAIKKEKKVTAGSLLLAKDTLCFLGELTKYKKDALETIKSVLESGQVVAHSPEENSQYSHESYPLTATLWTYCTKSSKIKMKEFCQSMKPFIDVFGTMFVCKEEDWETPALIQHMLAMHTGGSEHVATINQGFHQALKMLLRQVRERRLIMEPEASLLLKRYFVASRRAKANDGLKATDMPLKALQTMTTMAEGHAKLSLRESKVSVFDAIAAIKMYEENVAAQCGTSFVLEQPTLGGNKGHQKINEEMLVFWTRLEDFISHFAGDLSVSIIDEGHVEE